MGVLAADTQAQVPSAAQLTPNLASNIDRPLRYRPDGGDFVITNGGEFFNRPLYGGNTACRVDAGDQPEFVLYLPGRGGNLRLGVRTAAGAKWLHEAATIEARYRPGEMLYVIRDPLLGTGELRMDAVALPQTEGLAVRVELAARRPQDGCRARAKWNRFQRSGSRHSRRRGHGARNGTGSGQGTEIPHRARARQRCRGRPHGCHARTLNFIPRSMRAWCLFFLLVAVTAAAYAPRRFEFNATGALNEYDEMHAHGFEPGFPVRSVAGGVIAEGAFFYSVDVPEGNWRVTVELVGAPGGSRTTVKAELRRLMVETLALAPGATATRSFIVNVRNPRIPAQAGIEEGRVRLKVPRETTQEAWAWDNRLTLEFSGERPMVRTIQIEPAKVPTVFLLGDSTVCDQSREPYTSWGQMFTRFFSDRVAIASHAESGESYRDSLRERRLDKVMTLLQPGDWVLMQFGHNDQKQIDAYTGGPFSTYADEIRQYSATIKAGGGIPVVISPMERRRFDADGRVVPSLADYATAARGAAEEGGAAFIDLHAMSIPLYEALGPEKSLAAFAAPEGVLDETHHAAFGAYELARCVATAAKSQQLGFAAYLAADFQPFDPAHPDDPAAFVIPASPLVTSVRPLGD